MKPEYYFKIFIFILVLLVASISGCIQNQQNQTPPHQTISNQTPNPQSNSKYTVTIQNSTFTPHTIIVPIGTTVTWINQDSTNHQVTSNTKAFESKNLNTGDNYSFKFTKSGTYPYHCLIHPNMKGTIIVQ